MLSILGRNGNDNVGQVQPDVKISVVIPDFARPARTRGSSTHSLFCNKTTNDKRGRFPIETLGNDTNFMSRCFDKSGFTLIELLVVVLIIGILASVALPQYQFSVDKTRAMTQYQNIQAIIKTEQVYKMANGYYTGDFELLDVDWTKTCTLIGADHSQLAHCSGGFGFQMANPAAVPTEIWLRWCKEANSVCSSGDTNYHLLVRFSMTDGSVIGCGSRTTRGQKLCNYFTQQLGSSAS